MKLVATIVVSYNQCCILKNVLLSIIQQCVPDGFHHKVYLFDDCSSDDTSNIANEFTKLFPDKFTYIRNCTNIGPFKNLLHAYLNVDADFIAHCDGDDFWLPGKLATQLRILESNPEYDFCFTGAVTKDTIISVGSSRQVRIFTEFKKLFTHSPFIRSSYLERRPNQNLIINYSKTTDVIFDFEYYYILRKNSCGYIINTPYVFYNTDSNGISRNGAIHLLYSAAVNRINALGMPADLYRSLNIQLSLLNFMYSNGPAPAIIDLLSIKFYQPVILSKILLPKLLYKVLRYVKRIY